MAEVSNVLGEIEADLLYTGEHHARNAVCRITAGAGGIEARDWAGMLLAMYQRWCERREFKLDLLAIAGGDDARSFSTAEFAVVGHGAYGWMQSEHGIHRLSRVSPHGRVKKRHTSFASVEVVPDLNGAGERLAIKEGDLRVDTYRASGPGGQHRNTSDSAVRITHLPTGIVARCHKDRSQHRNKEIAMRSLEAKLVDRERLRAEEEIAGLKGERRSATFGMQSRSYVLHPYQLVKDKRSGHQTGNADSVLDGDLDGFMEAWLAWNASEA